MNPLAHSTTVRGETKHPAGGTLLSPLSGGISPSGGRRVAAWKVYCRVMSSSATAQRPFAVGPSSGALLDTALAAALFVGSLAVLHSAIRASRPGSVELNLVCVVLAACSTMPLVVWRRFPLGVFVMTAAASALLTGIGYLIELPLGLTAALYLLAASREWETPWTRRTTVTVVGLLGVYLGAQAAGQVTFPGLVQFHTAVVWAVAWFAGERTRLRSEQIVQLKERALDAEHEAERERQLAAATERARIARDLHDSAGHAISVIAVRAGAARLRHHQDPDRSLRALEAIEELARQTAEEIDQMVGTLREGRSANGVVEAPPGLASLDTLIAHRVATGLEVMFDASGPQRPLGTAVDQAAYRIIQEALTNAARHGAGSVRVELAFVDAAVELTITNPVLAGGSPQSGGHGLTGMRERATLLGGYLAAECANGTFRVRARIPYGGHSA